MQGLRLLVVEPDEPGRRALLEQAAGRGVLVDAVPTGLEGLQRFATPGPPYGAVLVAQELPDLDGLSLIRAMRAVAGAAAPPFVLLARDPAAAPPEAMDPETVAACLARPVDPVPLFACLDALVAPGPVASAHAPAPLVPAHDEPARSAGERVLLVEDNTTNQTVAAAMVQQMGFEVEVASDGHEALDAIRRQPYALVLMDLHMPGMDGFQATAAIRALDGPARHVPIVALTADVMEGAREACLAAGMDDYLTKPCKRKPLEEMLARWIGPAVVPAAAQGDGAPAGTPVVVHDPALDAYLRELIDELGAASVREIVGKFLASVPEEMRALAGAAAAMDAPAVLRVAHSLKTSFGIIGAGAAAACCAQIEADARTHALVPTPARIAGLEQTWQDIRRMLSESPDYRPSA